ncbi:MAG: tRNA (N6-isopentenyl adenosine(37)-C2)-methylthiotransferase MiaB [Oscillospiraceae bacterium]|nr:tRNA (N6-isopentenyl adenosine(37)-C2)-methylthiotransferase MiaB [Oscillospiraceae bacterium]
MYERKEITQAQLDEQQGYCEKIRAAISPRQHYALVDTYGCQQNESDSEILRGWLMDCGYSLTEDTDRADVIVVNTCAVREHAELRVFGNVGALNHAKRKNPELIVAVGGCMTQQETVKNRLRDSFRVVDLVFGPHEVWKFPELLWRTLERHGRRGARGRLIAAEPSQGVVAENLPRQRDSGIKAWLSIMNGCDNFCSYCIVPYVRGRERSRRPADILAEARRLAEAEYRDITLLGQNVNSYGKGLEEGVDFPDLLRAIDGVEGDFVLRFMTSHPKDATEKLFRAMAECGKTARHIHLPAQSGSDRVLKAMNRYYDRKGYLEKVALARRYMPDLVLTTDIIVGFPGETEAEFEETLSLVEEIRYDAMFTFIYSPRTGTPAAAMPDPVSREEKQARFDRLLEAANRISAEKHAEYVGKTYRVLVDGETDDPVHNLSARTKGGRLVHLSGDPALVGRFTDAEITDSSTWALFGRAAE